MDKDLKRNSTKNHKEEFSYEELENRNKGLIELTEILEENNIEYYLTDGVLLGAIRDKDFIKWDWDVELTVLTENIWDKVDILLESAKKNQFIVTNLQNTFKNFKINFIKRNAKYSLNGLYIDGNQRLRKLYRYPSNFFLKPKRIQFKGKEYPAPSDIEGYLEYQYGNWKIPISKSTRFKKKRYLTKEVRRDSGFIFFFINKFLAFNNLLKKNLRFSLYSIGIKRKSRELNFEKMYFKGLQENSSIIEIGTSDGSEILSILKNKKRPKNLKFYVLEPSLENLNLAKKRLIGKKHKDVEITFFNLAIGVKNSTKTFYFSTSRPNLNSLIPRDIHDSKKSINFRKLEDFCIEEKINSPLFIKMDIEGQEVSVLSSSIKFLKSIENVSILVEIHPTNYSPHNSFYETLIKLFSIGFKPEIVESAGTPIPKKFKEHGYLPFEINQGRGLYENISEEFILNYATKNIQEYLPEFRGENDVLTLKQIRSILFTKEN